MLVRTLRLEEPTESGAGTLLGNRFVVKTRGLNSGDCQESFCFF